MWERGNWSEDDFYQEAKRLAALEIAANHPTCLRSGLGQDLLYDTDDVQDLAYEYADHWTDLYVAERMT
jgi:hypothetical protein